MPVPQCGATWNSSVICISPRIQVGFLNVHRDIPVDIHTAIDEFARHHSRKMRLAQIIDDEYTPCLGVYCLLFLYTCNNAHCLCNTHKRI